MTLQELNADPALMLAAAALGVALVVLFVLLLRRPNGAVADLQAGQHRLAGALGQIAESSASSQRELQKMIAERLDAVGDRLGRGISDGSRSAAETLGALEARLEAIDKAQANIERLSSDVLSLQDILSNKQTRGAFGEIQLNDLITNALPPAAYAMQATLSNGRRVDALLRLPSPPGALAIDAKFPLEPYEAMRAAETPEQKAQAERLFRQAIRTHVAAIAERYIVPGETADGALMFLPSEAVYAELHANFADLVREGFSKRVWIVSPTTLMATLNTMRAVMKDARLREEAGDLRRELGLLGKDVERLAARVDALQTHFGKAEKDLGEVKTSARKALARLRRIEGDGTGALAADDVAADGAELVALQGE